MPFHIGNSANDLVDEYKPRCAARQAPVSAPRAEVLDALTTAGLPYVVGVAAGRGAVAPEAREGRGRPPTRGASAGGVVTREELFEVPETRLVPGSAPTFHRGLGALLEVVAKQEESSAAGDGGRP
jgi:hypothetical protein